jgi:hypothetical protein
MQFYLDAGIKQLGKWVEEPDFLPHAHRLELGNQEELMSTLI